MSAASERAERARQLLDDPLVQGALNGIETDALEKALAANTFDPNEAISALCHLRAAHSIRPLFTSLITSGEAEGNPRPAVA